MADLKKHSYWFQRHPGITLLGFTLVLFVFGLILAEFAARLFIRSWAPPRAERVNLWTYDALLGWTHFPGQHSRFAHTDFSIDVKINSSGLRDTEYALERTKNKRRMLVLGDSFGWGFGVEIEDRFSEILERKYPNWEIINASVSGYSTDQQYLYLKEQGIRFQPDVICLLFCDNDFDNNIKSEAYWYFKPYFTVDGENLKLHNAPVPESTIRQKLDRYFYGKTYLWGRIYNRLAPFLFRHEKKNQNRDRKNSYQVTQRLIKELNTLALSNNAEFILVSIPIDQEKRKVLQTISTQENIPYCAMDSHFMGNQKQFCFPIDVHWNSEGHKTAAEAIAAFLEKEQLL